MTEDKNLQPVNEEANLYNSWVDRIVAWLKDLAMKIAAGYFPWLDFFPIKQIAQWFITRKSKELSKYIKQRVTGEVIEKQIEEKVSGAVEARDALKDALARKDLDAIKKASEEFDAKYAKLIRSGGNSTNVNN